MASLRKQRVLLILVIRRLMAHPDALVGATPLEVAMLSKHTNTEPDNNYLPLYLSCLVLFG